MNDRMILPRVSRDETTFAVIEFAGVARLDLKRAVRQAVAAWVRCSPQGRRALADVTSDFNVGDLANELGDPDLQRELAKQELSHLTIDVYCDLAPTRWEFDDRLASDDESTAASPW